MHHRIGGFRLNKDTEHRIALRRNMAASLFMHGQITTTIPKAKSVRPFVEKMITLAKKGNEAAALDGGSLKARREALHYRRLVISRLRDRIPVRDDQDASVERNKYGEVINNPKTTPKLVKMLFEEIAPKYKDRKGGYTRIIKLSRHRIGDGGQMCVLQLVGDEEGPQVSGQKSRRREKANRRMDFAAKARKAAAEKAAPAKTEAPAEGSPAEGAQAAEGEKKD